MKLSVIVPSLTGEVSESLRSQLEGRADVELVVVKGVSPVGKARNEGLARATGDYIAWVDGDDEVADGWLEEIMSRLRLAPQPELVVIGHEWVMPDGFALKRPWTGEDLVGAVLSQRGCRSEMWNYVIRRELWKGIRFDDAARTHEDWAVVPRLLVRVRRFEILRKPLYRYRANAQSLTNSTDPALLHEALSRSLARIEQVKALGLWGRYRQDTLIGIANTVCPNPYASGWLRRNLPSLFRCSVPLRSKARWFLAAIGCRKMIDFYYVLRK